MLDNKLCWNHMVDGYVYMAAFTLVLADKLYMYT